MSRALRVLLLVLAVTGALLTVPGTASAAPARAGYDVSHPQCDRDLPRDPAFAIVGVNGGLSTKGNPCLAAQLAWAWQSSGSIASQPRAQLYLNTANPGMVRDRVVTWPTAGSTPYGVCDGGNTTACSWQYGVERAAHSVETFFTTAAREARVDGRPASYVWWLDVETMNTWQYGSTGAQARNRATLEGMAAYLLSRGGRVGIYSTHQQWGQIVGTVPSTSNLAGRPSWLAGATTLSGAEDNCGEPPLVPRGTVPLTQYVRDGLDHNHACR